MDKRNQGIFGLSPHNPDFLPGPGIYKDGERFFHHSAAHLVGQNFVHTVFIGNQSQPHIFHMKVGVHVF